MKILNNILNKFYGSFLGGFYLEILLWIDKRSSKNDKYLTPNQISQIIRESNKLAEGTLAIKNKVNSLLSSRNKEEYQIRLSEITDLLPLSTYDDVNSSRAKYVDFLKSYAVRHGTDVTTVTDRAKMVEKRIEDMYELQDHIVKRNLLRDLRKARVNNNIELAESLQKEYKEKYGR